MKNTAKHQAIKVYANDGKNVAIVNQRAADHADIETTIVYIKGERITDPTSVPCFNQFYPNRYNVTKVIHNLYPDGITTQVKEYDNDATWDEDKNNAFFIITEMCSND